MNVFSLRKDNLLLREFLYLLGSFKNHWMAFSFFEKKITPSFSVNAEEGEKIYY
jgi:hypothetical protein